MLAKEDDWMVELLSMVLPLAMVAAVILESVDGIFGVRYFANVYFEKAGM